MFSTELPTREERAWPGRLGSGEYLARVCGAGTGDRLLLWFPRISRSCLLSSGDTRGGPGSAGEGEGERESVEGERVRGRPLEEITEFDEGVS